MTHWSKKGSKMITSSPGSMKPMKALSIPEQSVSYQSRTQPSMSHLHLHPW